MAGLVRDAGFDRFLACALSDQRALEEALDSASASIGKHQVQVVMVADLAGLQWSRALRAVPQFKRLSRILDDNFPERLCARTAHEVGSARVEPAAAVRITPARAALCAARHVAFVARAPWIFASLWKLVEPFLAEDTKAKVKICGRSTDHLAELAKLVDPSEIPDWLGGQSKSGIPDGSTQRCASSEADEADEAATPDVPATPSTVDLE